MNHWRRDHWIAAVYLYHRCPASQWLSSYNALAEPVSCTQTKHYLHVTAVPDVICDVLIQTIAALPPIRGVSSCSHAFYIQSHCRATVDAIDSKQSIQPQDQIQSLFSCGPTFHSVDVAWYPRQLTGTLFADHRSSRSTSEPQQFVQCHVACTLFCAVPAGHLPACLAPCTAPGSAQMEHRACLDWVAVGAAHPEASPGHGASLSAA